ncbi:hypothetical protein M5689_008602 [Euphorbia peplus]|nr:hypothetical protein M5689_008602 [Euphorbia peplus]
MVPIPITEYKEEPSSSDYETYGTGNEYGKAYKRETLKIDHGKKIKLIVMIRRRDSVKMIAFWGYIERVIEDDQQTLKNKLGEKIRGSKPES